MNNTLSEKALEDLVIAVSNLCAERGILLSVRPTHMIIPRLSDEDDAMYAKRVRDAHAILRSLDAG